MEIFGVGPLEIILVLILALVVLGPQDMVATAYKIGAWIRKIVRSPMWREIMETSREIRQIPTTLIRDSGIEEAMAEVKETGVMVKNEVGQATQEVSGQLQQASTELNAEAAAAAEAQTAPTGMPPLSPQIPPVQPWVEASGNQPAPPLPADYPQTIPLGVAEPPEAVILPSESASAGSTEQAADPAPEENTPPEGEF